MKLATIGRGFIVDRALSAIQNIPEIQLEAVYSRSMDEAEQFAKRHNSPKAYDDLDRMLADEEIDVIYIASPNTLHYPQAKKALEAGKHVILEKPFVSSYEQAKELFDLAEKNNVMIFEAITTIHTGNFKKLKEQIQKAGQIRQGVLNFSQFDPRYELYKKGTVTNVFDPVYDGGALTDVNIYNVHFAVRLFGIPESVQYFPNSGWNGIDTSGTLVMRYPDFVITALGAKDHTAPWHSYISGDQGVFVIDQGSLGRMNHVTFQGNMNSEIEEISLPQDNHMVFEFSDFLKAISNNDREAYQDYKNQTLKVQKIIDEAKEQRN